jgi:hypothetical protein
VKRRDFERYLRAHGVRKVGEGAKHSRSRSADGLRAAQLDVPVPQMR